MVGALIFITALALGPGAERADADVSRGVMSEAVSFHVRSTDARVRTWFRIGAADSQTFRDLLRALGESDLIVHVQPVDRLPTAGQTYFVGATASVRYVRIEVVPSGSTNEMVALIGHELQHAVEIAHEPQIRDRRSLALFYRSIAGNSSATTDYDSVAARIIEDRVKREVAGAARSESHPSADALVARRNR
jgi:hypothetical protein